MTYLDTEQRAASGEIDAQREMIDNVLRLGRTGLCSWRDAIEHALWWARLAERRSEVLLRDPIIRKISIPNQDTVRLYRILELCTHDAIERGDTERHELYLGEMVAVLDDLAERGDAEAEHAVSALGGMPETVSARALHIAKVIRSIRQGDQGNLG